MTPDRPHLTTAEVAAVLGMTDRGVRLLIKKGQLPAERLGRDWLVQRADLERLVAQRKTKAEAET